MQHNLAFICQIVALACFFIGWMNWQIPKTKPWNWMCGGFFWVLLSLMIGHFVFGVSLHPVGG